MRARTCFVSVVVALFVAGCGGGGSPSAPSSSSLTTLDRLAIARQVVTTALGGVVSGSPVVKASGSVPLAGLTCQKTCAGASCSVSCPIDERLDCPSGGTATDEGQITGTLDADLTGSAALQAAQTFASCKPNADLTISGAPATTAVGDARFVEGELADSQTVQVTGSVSYVSASAGSGQCAVDVRVTFDRALKGSARGSACDQPVDVSF